ncbi:hypothetical protein [Paludibaculum fermentans]|uniref:hypothetical protein n=1 Tax=Paludibaculum fermentans TaxID=1473598 RepID=UPI003EB91FA4
MLLRLAVAIFLLERCVASHPFPLGDNWPAAIAALAGVFLLAGLWTPIAAAVTAVLEFSFATRTADAAAAHYLAAAIGAGLTLLGPGAWSVDARLFGRRRISLSRGE